MTKNNITEKRLRRTITKINIKLRKTSTPSKKNKDNNQKSTRFFFKPQSNKKINSKKYNKNNNKQLRKPSIFLSNKKEIK